MRFRAEYTLSFLLSPQKGLHLPIRINLEGKVFEISELCEDGKSAKAFVEGPVDRDTLVTEVDPKLLIDKKPSKVILFPEQLDFSYFISKMIHLLSFLIDTPIRYSHKLFWGSTDHRGTGG